MTKISVIVPIYNSKKYLKRCLNSLVNQTLHNIEIILVNDGSTDGSEVILNEYQNLYPSKIIIINKDNGGQASARNVGIEYCSGKYIGFVDADDYVDITMFEKLYHKAEVENSDLVVCKYNYIKINDDGEITFLKPYLEQKLYEHQKDMFFDTLVSPWTKLYRKDIIIKSKVRFPENVIYEDTAFFINLIPFINKISGINERLVYHVLWESSTMRLTTNTRAADIFKVMDNILSFYKLNGYYDSYRDELEYFYVRIMFCSSLQRLCRISDKTKRIECIKYTQQLVKKNFPQYRSNRYLKNDLIGIYLKSINNYTIRLYSNIFRVIIQLKGI